MELDVVVQIAGVVSAGAFAVRTIAVLRRKRLTVEKAMDVCEKIVEGRNAVELERARRETLAAVAANLRPGGLLIDQRSDGSSIRIRYEAPDNLGLSGQLQPSVVPDPGTAEPAHGVPSAGPPPKAA